MLMQQYSYNDKKTLKLFFYHLPSWIISKIILILYVYVSDDVMTHIRIIDYEEKTIN